MSRKYDQFTSPGLASIRYVAQRGLLKPLVWSITRVKVIGTDQLRGLEPPFIAVANHASHLDAPLVIGALPQPLSRYLASGAAADYFFDVRWRKWLTALFFNAFPIERGGARTRAGLSRKLLERGVALLIFPEGGRSRTGETGPFKPGAAALSMSVDVPCVPIAIVGTNTAMPRGQNWPSKGRPRVAVVFGAPMRHEPGESTEHYSARLAEEVRRLHATAPAGSLSAYANKGE